MQLPPTLREATERELEGVPLRDLARALSALSQRYRGEVRDGRLHLDDETAARAYLATRLPATFAAITAALNAVTAARPDFAPRTMLDAGAGPGTATWAAAERWESLEHALLIEASPAIRAAGERLSRALRLSRCEWMDGRLDGALPELARRDLVLLAYVLDEVAPAAREPLIARLWSFAGDTLVIVEPGTPAGWKRILQVRDQLIQAGAHLLAPCPHARACPLSAPDWCHFAARVSRSHLHREAKGATVPWEDEKFIYLAASRHAATAHRPRVIAPPRRSKSAVAFKLCRGDGALAERIVARRAGADFRSARRLDWGDTLPFDGIGKGAS